MRKFDLTVLFKGLGVVLYVAFLDFLAVNGYKSAVVYINRLTGRSDNSLYIALREIITISPTSGS